MPNTIVNHSFHRGFFNSPFRPAPFLANPHLQTLFASFHRNKPAKLQRERQRISLADGDFVLLDTYTPAQVDARAPLVLIVHGLSGSSESHYVLGLQKVLAEQHWPSVAMNCRGATEPNQATRAYHAGASDDVIAVFEYLAQQQSRSVVIVGYSLGGSMTLKALAELGKHPRLLAGVAVSTPLELVACAKRLDTGFSMIYRKHLLSELNQLWRSKQQYLEKTGESIAAKRIQQCLDQGPFTSFWQFDDVLMAPLHGFNDVYDYYARCRPNQFLKDIQVPTLVIHALDDPFMSPLVVPKLSELSPMIHFELAQQGGHVGFISGTLKSPVYYLEQRVPAFLNFIVDATVAQSTAA